LKRRAGVTGAWCEHWKTGEKCYEVLKTGSHWE